MIKIFVASEKLKGRAIEILAMIILVIAFLAMIGWVFEIDELTRVIPTGINMKFATAMVFFASAVALYMIFRLIRDGYELSFVILPGLSMFIFLIMSVLLAAEVTNTQTGIESLFVREQSPIYSFDSGLPSIVTMANFILFGLVCLYSLFNNPSRQKVIKFVGWFIAIINIINIINILGYIFSISVFYLKIYDLVPITLNSALTFLLLGLGLIIIGKIETKNET